MLYDLLELNRALLCPATALAQAGARMFSSPESWLSRLPGAAHIAANYEFLYHLGKDYERPPFAIHSAEVRGRTMPVIEQTVMTKPFCRLQHFKRYADQPNLIHELSRDPVVLLVAPLSGHHATLLRDTAQTLLSGHDVYITDWMDARMVPLSEGPFTLEDYVGYIKEFIRHLGGERLHVISVCQPTVPVLAAVALMAVAGEPAPCSLTLMGGPIDARRGPTRVNDLATSRPLSWFETCLIQTVPPKYPGRGRRVFPGFLQHASFVAMNPSRHIASYVDYYKHLVQRDLARASAHRRFYDEYNAVLDMPAEYYLDCVRIVFQQHLLARGLWTVDGERVAPEAITKTALLTIEGALDDVSGPGQTHAAHDLCRRLAANRKQHLTVSGAGHYGIFSGRRWRQVVYPCVRDFIRAAEKKRSAKMAQPRVD